MGLGPNANLPDNFALGEGLVGEAARGRKTVVLRDLDDSFFAVRSALGATRPRHLVITPLVVDGQIQGVMEIGMLHAPDARSLAMLDRTRDSVAVAIRSVHYRDQLRVLLEETQGQAEELQTQQEELRVANEELEEHGQALKASQSRLEQQQAELEATNAQLEGYTHTLEQQAEALAASKREAERANRYKSEFLANMSHELRTPLNSALILAKLLADNKGASAVGRPGSLCGDHLCRRQHAAHADQRHPRPLEDRGRRRCEMRGRDAAAGIARRRAAPDVRSNRGGQAALVRASTSTRRRRPRSGPTRSGSSRC